MTKVKNEVSAGGIVYKKLDDSPRKDKLLWLVVQHSQHKGWVFPKGLVGDTNPNEKKQTAAVREVEEEGGVKATIVYPEPIKVKYVYQWSESPHGGKRGEKILVKKTVYYFLMNYLSGDPKNHDWEVSEAKFLTEKEVKKILTYETDRKAFEKALEIYHRLPK